MREFFTKRVTALLTLILGSLGFQACGTLDVVGGGMCMYGQPHADFRVKGTVTDKDKQPLQGVQVVVKTNIYQERSDTLYTDAQGKVLLEQRLFDGPEKVTLEFRDIDGTANGGEFEDKVLENHPVRRLKKGDGAWYNGEFEAKFEVTLTKQ